MITKCSQQNYVYFIIDYTKLDGKNQKKNFTHEKNGFNYYSEICARFEFPLSKKFQNN